MQNESNISGLNHNDCCGCKACGDVCPVNCISFNKDDEGFIYPCVNEDLCLSCGKCNRICPELNLNLNKSAKECIAAYANKRKERNAGSSGGIFGLLANEIFVRGGKVWGAAFDENLKLIHCCAENDRDLVPILKSKYIQSNTNHVFSSVLKDVKSGIITLFSGTPCQCNAIRNIVGNNDLLITVEVICHGVPSQMLFDKSIKWLEDNDKSKIKSFVFRSKYKGALHPQSYSYEKIKDGKRMWINGLHYQFPYYFGFQKHLTLRPSCYRCKWAVPNRTADITLGDFWGIDKYEPTLNAKTGISQVILNTERGREIYDSILMKNKIWSKCYPIQYAIENNECLKTPTQMPINREEFFKALNSDDFNIVVDKYLIPRRKWIFDLYYGMPSLLRKFIRKLMDKRMRYE